METTIFNKKWTSRISSLALPQLGDIASKFSTKVNANGEFRIKKYIGERETSYDSIDELQASLDHSLVFDNITIFVIAGTDHLFFSLSTNKKAQYELHVQIKIDNETTYFETINRFNENIGPYFIKKTQALPNVRDDVKEVFVVHGHDYKARDKVVDFLIKNGLEPVVLDKKANRGRVLLQKLEDHSEVSYAVVLLTPDDIAKERHTKGIERFRARQNVVFELGYFFGMLGRDKVCVLYKGAVEEPSDIKGLIMVKMDAGQPWQDDLERELRELSLI